MLGTFAGALDARKINAKDGRLTADVLGEVEEDNKVLVIRRVHVNFRLRAENPDEIRETVNRVHRVYAEGCPVYRSLKPAFRITSDVEVKPEDIAGS
jgi:uncharacterized OsmC-like protein